MASSIIIRRLVNNWMRGKFKIVAPTLSAEVEIDGFDRLFDKQMKKIPEKDLKSLDNCTKIIILCDHFSKFDF